MYMETTDHVLVKRALAGEAAAFSDLITRHYDLIFRLAFRTLGQQAEAEDLTQDICAALPGKLVSFRSEAKFTTWLYRVTMNAALDRIRKRQSRQKAGHGWGELEQMTRTAVAEQSDELKWLEQAMTRLTPDLRQTVALVLGEELTHAQAAQTLEVSEGTISWRMSEVKKALREIAKEEERIE
ncbi:MAG: RNA polymerase sigma-70 factor (ECF subfamily) [Paracoccaceae bacterium]|jgi:RNA polymerase sigma-70 factor (ECF subfamily)